MGTHLNYKDQILNYKQQLVKIEELVQKEMGSLRENLSELESEKDIYKRLQILNKSINIHPIIYNKLSDKLTELIEKQKTELIIEQQNQQKYSRFMVVKELERELEYYIPDLKLEFTYERSIFSGYVPSDNGFSELEYNIIINFNTKDVELKLNVENINGLLTELDPYFKNLKENVKEINKLKEEAVFNWLELDLLMENINEIYYYKKLHIHIIEDIDNLEKFKSFEEDLESEIKNNVEDIDNELKSDIEEIKNGIDNITEYFNNLEFTNLRLNNILFDFAYKNHLLLSSDVCFPVPENQLKLFVDDMY